MSDNKITLLEDAKQQLTKIMGSLNKSHREHLLSFAIQEWMTITIEDDSDDDVDGDDEDILDDPVAMLNTIVKEIRDKVPLNAVLPSENIKLPEKSTNGVYDPKISVQVDGFLYNEDDVEDLVKDGKLPKYYCKDCGSKNIDTLRYLSPSTSRDEVYHIFNTLLPTLDGKIVLDVGSRLGAVLYGAYVYTDADKIIGVEMNKDLCDLQNEVVRKYKMDKRIEVINKRIEDADDVLQTADVVVLNNVFESYLSKEEQTIAWKFLRETMKKGAFIVSRPSISSSLSTLSTGIDVDQWVKPVEAETQVNCFDSTGEKDDNLSEIFCYTVL